MKKKKLSKILKNSFFVGIGKKSDDAGEVGGIREWAKTQFESWSRLGRTPIIMKVG